ncbi:Heterokaryon incompatibility protein s [Paramyrothecium foliicola]|nr:Heterokaryon incompatibility protein s [Paramyrothecium foliicola]
MSSYRCHTASLFADVLTIQADLRDSSVVSSILDTVRERLGAPPTVVVYNAAALTIPSDESNIFSIPLENFERDLAIMDMTAFVAAGQAVAGFESPQNSVPKAFIHIGNILAAPTRAVPRIITLGTGKSAASYWIGAASGFYKDKGYRFHFADERKADCNPLALDELSGSGAGEFYLQLAEEDNGIPWFATFVAGRGSAYNILGTHVMAHWASSIIMEAAGLAIGVVTLAGTFNDCITLFSYFSSYRSLGRDYEILETKLDVEKTLLLQWAQRVRLLQPDHDPRLGDALTQNAVSKVLASIQRLLSESSALQDRYGMKPLPQTSIPQTQALAAAVSGGYMKRFYEDLQSYQTQSDGRQLGVARAAKLRWAINDKDKFEKLVEQLAHFTAKLHALIPDTDRLWEKSTAKLMLEETLSQLKDFRILEIIRKATIEAPECVAEPAKARFEEVLHAKLLERIWFRTMDDRLEAVASAHRKTFSWALGPDAALSSWLISGSGMFWLSGKAGSGKSTLMKYLFTHEKTRSHLSAWASGRRLILGSFFFWNLGASEQKSHIGLCRAILYQLLAYNMSLLPNFLPRMWKEACSCETNLDALSAISPPSLSELKAAFHKLIETTIEQRFCFFIDGLDEYEGSLSNGIRFVQQLGLNASIKVILSSRPIPLCVDAFSSLPRIQLQDVTRGDIQTYVHDTIGSHKYMVKLQAINPTGARMVIEELIDKSSGVFLWVVLACRSVTNGFAAYDSVQELSRRVKDLPPELEGMFRHMLLSVEPRYLEQAAKMLSICHQRKVNDRLRNRRGTLPSFIDAIPWNLLDEAAMDVETALPLEPNPSDPDFIHERVEARLRSRCGGLLELRRIPASSKELNLDVFPVTAVVEFMHRTVFEFLDSPGTWNMDYLRIAKSNFNANASLAFMSMQLWYFKRDATWVDALADTLFCARQADAEGYEFSDLLLEGMAQVVLDEELSLMVDEGTRASELIGQYGIGAFKMALSVEAGMVKYASHHLTQFEPHPVGLPLLYHALSKVVLAGIFISPPDTLPIVRYLVSVGCDPNEPLSVANGPPTTPWEFWVSRVVKSPRAEQYESLGITEALIRTGSRSNVDKLLETVLEGHTEQLSYSRDSDSRKQQAELQKVLDLLKQRRQGHETEESQGPVHRGLLRLLSSLPSMR